MRLASHRLKLAVAPPAPAKSGAPSVPESENRLQTCVYRCAFQRVTRRTDIECLRFHDLRHEATTHLFERSLTGHKDLLSDY
jgi:integrase